LAPSLAAINSASAVDSDTDHCSVIFHQCIRFLLHGLNPLLLLRGVYSSPVCWISTTSNSSACQRRNVAPDVIHTGRLTVRIGRPVALENSSSVSTSRVFSDCDDSDIVSSCLFSATHLPVSTTELVQTRSGLK
jgi:hypothetical protein